MGNVVTEIETLYRTVGPGLLAYLRGGFADATTAEDLLQETFCQAARRHDRLAAARSPRAWLYAIARNLAITALRRRRPTAPLPVELPADESTPDPRLEPVRAAIAQLPNEQRETLELRLHGELTYEEIATVLNVPIGTVRSRLHNALRRLRAACRDDVS